MKLLTLFRTPSIRRSISASFVLVTIVVVAMVTVSYFQLRQVRPFSNLIVQNSSDLVDVQRLASATSALDADLERYLVIRGAEYRDNVQNDLQEMTGALALLQVDPIEGTETSLSELETIIAALQEKIGPLLDINSTSSSSAEINRLIVTIYNDIEQVKLLQNELSENTLASLQTTAQAQGQIADNVLTQSVILGVIVSFVAVLTTLLTDRRLRTISSLTDTAVAISGGDISRVAPVESNDEIGTLANAFNTMTNQLRELIGSLEKRVTDRTKALATVAEVSTTTSTILETQKLLQEVVDLTKERFSFYHAHIYLVDDSGENLVLASGAGEPGRQMLAKGLSIPLNREQSLVARAARERKGVSVNDVTQAPDFLPNPLLPNTRSELAVPMIVGGQVIGVFDVQSDQVGRFTDADIDIQTTLASQVAVSIQNTRQYAESQQFKLGIENSGDAIFATDTNGTITYANPAFEKVYGYSPAEVIGKNPRIIKSGLLSSENYEAFWGALLSKQSVTGEIVNKHKDGHLVYIAGTNSAIVNDDGDIVGFLAVHHDVTEQKSNQDILAQRAKQQEALNQISQRIQSATTIEDAMQVAARELGHALGKRQTLVALEPSALGGEYKGKN